jgi:transposase
MFTWVEDIRDLYRLNGRRLERWEEARALSEQSPAFMEHHKALCRKLNSLADQRDASLQEPLHSAQKKVLKSLKNHWQGLTVFIERPQVAMDNNTAQRSVRNPVTGRKNYYGSGSVWSAHLAARMFTLLQTVMLWGLNPRHWLYAYLKACAENGGKSPLNLSPFLPWAMDEERQQNFSQPLREDWPILPRPLDEPDITDTS